MQTETSMAVPRCGPLQPIYGRGRQLRDSEIDGFWGVQRRFYPIRRSSSSRCDACNVLRSTIFLALVRLDGTFRYCLGRQRLESNYFRNF